jgi:hypothetical protein
MPGQFLFAISTHYDAVEVLALKSGKEYRVEG